MTRKLVLSAIAMAGGLAAFIGYVVASNFAAAGWAAIASILAGYVAWDTWKNHRTGLAEPRV